MTTPTYPVVVRSPSGLSIQINANGSIRRIDHKDIILNLFLGNEIEGGPANIFLRRHFPRRAAPAIESIPVLGPRSPAAIEFRSDGFTARGEWKRIRFCVSLVLAESAPAWFWHVTLENRRATAETIDLIYAQDVALADYGAVRLNEYYVSQYIDHTPLTHPERGTVVAVRQNLAMGNRHPWAAIGALGHAVSFATDALQLHGLATRAGDVPVGLTAATLPGIRHQHEHSMVVIQDAQVVLQPRARSERGFFGWFEENHDTATSPADLAFVDKALALPEAKRVVDIAARTPPPAKTATLFSSRPSLTTLPLTRAEITNFFGTDVRVAERQDRTLLSFFTGTNRHVVLRAKELQCLRPHGHIMRTGDRLVPDEASLTSTTWMAGVFNSLLTQGHVSINRVLSTTRSYLGLLCSSGQRLFVELAGGYELLCIPSAYEIGPNSCRWLYKYRGGIIQVRSWAGVDRHELNLTVEVVDGPPLRFLLSHHVAINGDDGAVAVPVQYVQDRDGIIIRPVADSDVGHRFPNGSFRIDTGRGTTIERVGGDELLFLDGQSRQQQYLVVVTALAPAVSFRITGALLPDAGATGPAAPFDQLAADERRADEFWSRLSGPVSLRSPRRSALRDGVDCAQEILPWFTQNAMIHYLAPRGLEQFSGGGWGTRDVTQGPAEMLLAQGEWEPLRHLLTRVFKTQNPDGDWPQWFTFFERDRNIRAGDSHGDIVFWPLLALAQYIGASEDGTILDAVVPFFDGRGDDQAEKATIWAHVERALKLIGERVIPGTSLAVFGRGDWNDALQPVDPSMCDHLCSAWTVTLQHQTLTALGKALRLLGRGDEAARLEGITARIRDDFHRLLIVDNTLTGYAYFHPDQRIDYLLHPSDKTTGIRYSLLPMIHAIINDLLTPDQARTHIGYIDSILLAPDGARMFDHPFPYRGGPQTHFQRAESSTFFGREIGLMYMHAHLRYAESLARLGDADAFFRALQHANPIGIATLVPTARLRQANTYCSSSDAAFLDRYEASSKYAGIKDGTVALEGGWRVYSSGAGVATRLFHQCFLGLRRGKSRLIIDPVVPKALDGLVATVELGGRPVDVTYRVRSRGHGPTALTLNGTALTFKAEENPYRAPGVSVSMAAIHALVTESGNTLVVKLG